MSFQKQCLVLLMFATLVAVGSASAGSCSDATLNGVWGYTSSGFGGDGTPRAAVGQATADGNGNITGSETKSKDGTILTVTFTGTYSVAKNCTGSLTVTQQDGTTKNANFVFDDSKKGFQVIQTDSGHVDAGFGLAQGTVTCGLTGKKATFAANLSGTDNGVGPVAGVAQVILDGKGNISGTETYSLNGTIGTASLSGTYTENANCTGTAQITTQGVGTGNFNFVIVNGGKEFLLIQTDNNTIVSGTLQQ